VVAGDAYHEVFSLALAGVEIRDVPRMEEVEGACGEDHLCAARKSSAVRRRIAQRESRRAQPVLFTSVMPKIRGGRCST
jgi:hypothetical protein